MSEENVALARQLYDAGNRGELGLISDIAATSSRSCGASPRRCVA
jgi:hypothetical protein